MLTFEYTVEQRHTRPQTGGHGEAQVKTHVFLLSWTDTHTHTRAHADTHANSEACTPVSWRVHTIRAHTIRAHTVNLGTHPLPNEYTHTFRNSLPHRFRGLLAAEAARLHVQSSGRVAAHREERPAPPR